MIFHGRILLSPIHKSPNYGTNHSYYIATILYDGKIVTSVPHDTLVLRVHRRNFVSVITEDTTKYSTAIKVRTEQDSRHTC
jgi:hypothetical protein